MTDALTALAAVLAKLEDKPINTSHRLEARRIILSLQDCGWDISPDLVIRKPFDQAAFDQSLEQVRASTARFSDITAKMRGNPDTLKHGRAA